MRKCTKQIAAAFNAGKPRTVGNTHTDGTNVWLHGNLIIKRTPDGAILATLAGWNTPTTRERVNGITGAGFHQKTRLPYLNGERCDSREWYTITPATP